MAAAPLPGDERRHPDAPVEEWVFACWTPDADVGIVTGYRIVSASRGWYWAALARAGRPLLHVSEWDVPRRADPLLVKAEGLWAEHICDDPLRQWTVANETYASALDDPAEGLRRAYGTPTPIAFDLEWYATGMPHPVTSGYAQPGEVHGVVELAGERGLHLDAVPAWRWHRWGLGLAPVDLPRVLAHVGLRASFAFPDGTLADWVLTGEGWRAAR